MKIKCRKCGKKFDSDVYSGLCPKCGTYNGKHMYDSGAFDSIKTSGQEKDIPKPQAVYREPQKGGNSRAHLVFLAFAVPAALLVIPFLLAMVNLEWKREYLRQAIQTEHTVQKGEWESTLVLDGEYLESPVELTVLEGGRVNLQAKMPPEVALYGIRMEVSSEKYSFDGRLDEVYLSYESEGNVYYKKPLNSYGMRDYLAQLGLTEDDILYSYALGNGKAEEGYLFFLVDEQARHIGLLAQAHGGEEPQKVFAEGFIDLDGIPELELLGNSEEVE